MPCYNAEATVARAVQSIQAQTIQHWELIVVDDGSTDRSAEIVGKIAAIDARIRLVCREHAGVVEASNHGFSISNGSLIARMDADDVSLPERLEQQALALHRSPLLGAVSCLARFAGNSDTAGGYAHHVAWTNLQKTTKQIELNRFIDLPVPHPTLMYRREIIGQFGGYRAGDFPEDYEMLLRWIAAGVQVGKVDTMLYEWHDPATRLSRNDKRYDMAAFHQCKAPYLLSAIESNHCEDRELWIWGAGRPARKCARPIEAAWQKASGFIDIDPRKIGRLLHGSPVVSADDLPAINQAVILSYVGTRGARDSIRETLLASGRTEGIDFWICA